MGEASTSYLWDSQAAERIKRAVPEASILIMLRDPVERAYSQYWNDVREGLEKRSFLDALAEEQRSGPGGWGVSSLYIDCGRYADQVARYLDRFGAAGPRVVLRGLRRGRGGHDGGDPFVPGRRAGDRGCRAAADEPRSRCPGTGSAGRCSAAAGCAGSLGPRSHDGLRSRLRGALLKEVSPPPMDPAARALLSEIFRPEVARLAELLGRPPPWELSVARRVSPAGLGRASCRLGGSGAYESERSFQPGRRSHQVERDRHVRDAHHARQVRRGESRLGRTQFHGRPAVPCVSTSGSTGCEKRGLKAVDLAPRRRCALDMVRVAALHALHVAALEGPPPAEDGAVRRRRRQPPRCRSS